MKKSFLQCLATVLIAGFTSCSQQSSQTNSMLPDTVTMTKEQLMDKIKGGWAAQTIGVTYGGPTEFR